MTSALNTITQMQNATTMAQAKQAKTTGSTSSLDQNAFLNLLCKQMQNQDPMNPTSNDQMITEEAQFTQVNELQKLNTNVSGTNSLLTNQTILSQASSLIDKQVTLTDPKDSTKTISGKVTGASITSSGVNLTVNGSNYSATLLESISSTSK